MKPENLKMLLQSYIECKQSQDEFDGSGNIAVESDNPFRPNPLSDDSQNIVFDGGIFFAPSPLFSTEPVLNLPPNVIAIGRDLTRMAQEFSVSQPDKSIIKFKEICIVKEPVEQIISIPVIRDQKFSQKVTKASWKTCDKTALSGTHYVEAKGEIIFNQGETNKDIQIQILNSSDEADDLRFTIELNYDGLYTPNPITVSLKKIENLDNNEKSVLHGLPRSLPFSVEDIKYVLDGCLNARTFHMALTHLCSTNKVLDVQIALALELSSLCLKKSCGNTMQDDTILKVLTDFFRKDDYNF